MSANRFRVFVYGTLQEAEHNHTVLGDSTLVGPARTAPECTLYDLGPFPALVPGGETAVWGELYEVDGPTLTKLDRLEGHPQFYQRTWLKLEDGSRAFTYVMRANQVRGRRQIRSGNWRNYRKECRCEFT
jgi:gamma-glutamylaminecyclotransferase